MSSESYPEGSKNKKKEDQQVSPSKRKRVGGDQEKSRMKEFLAGNIATSSSRIAFLESLCNLPKFQEMVDLVLIMVSLYILRNLVNI